MSSPDSLEITAPKNSFELVTLIIEQNAGELGNDRTRRRVTVDKVLPEDLIQPTILRPGIGKVLDELPAIHEAQPLEGEQFCVVRLSDEPLMGPEFASYTFVLSSAGRVIDLRARRLQSSNDSDFFTPPPIEELFKEIRTAKRIQPKLKIPAE